MKESLTLTKEVFLGRGPGCYRKPGNNNYRSIVKLYATDFHRGLQRAEKSKFIENLKFKLEMQGYRFFSMSNEQKNWVSASDLEVKQKIAHDLRDHRPLMSNGNKAIGKSKYIKKSQSSLKCKALEQNKIGQNHIIRGENQKINLAHAFNNSINYATMTGLLQIPGFYYGITSNFKPFQSVSGNKNSGQLHLFHDVDFDKYAFNQIFGSGECEDDNISVGRMAEPILENPDGGIIVGKPSSFQTFPLNEY
jgi:hypothetical protein